jgi:hypothetical protein
MPNASALTAGAVSDRLRSELMRGPGITCHLLSMHINTMK